MALPKQVNALIDPDDLSVYADRGKLNLEQIGFLNVSGTSHTLHNPGGTDGQLQYNDGGGFGGATVEFNDATGQTLFASGTASDPSISFKDSTSTGLFLDAGGLDLHIVADGTEHFDLGGGVTRLLSNIDAQSRNIIDINVLTAVTGTFTAGATFGPDAADTRIVSDEIIVSTITANNLGQQLSAQTFDIIEVGHLTTENGTVGIPSHSFVNDSQLGMFRAASSRLGLVADGALRAEVTTSGIEIPAGHRVTVDDTPLALITEVGEVNTGLSTGAGTAVFTGKSGPVFNIRSIEGNNGIDTFAGSSAVQVRFNGNAENLVETRNIQILDPEDRTYVLDVYAQYIYDVLEARFQTTSGNPIFTVNNSLDGDILGLTSITVSGTPGLAEVQGVGNEDRVFVGARLSVTLSSTAGSSDLVFSIKTLRKNNP